MQSASSRIWTRIIVFISNDDNHYTTDTYLSTRVYVTLFIVIQVMLTAYTLVISYYLQSLLVSLLDGNQFLTGEYEFLLVVQHWCVHV